jgi:uncharacterized membrane-anchored protein YhcB (DUF1043 family)
MKNLAIGVLIVGLVLAIVLMFFKIKETQNNIRLQNKTEQALDQTRDSLNSLWEITPPPSGFDK